MDAEAGGTIPRGMKRSKLLSSGILELLSYRNRLLPIMLSSPRTRFRPTSELLWWTHQQRRRRNDRLGIRRERGMIGKHSSSRRGAETAACVVVEEEQEAGEQQLGTLKAVGKREVDAAERRAEAGPKTYRVTCRSCKEGNLYCCEETIACIASGCVQCAYKLVAQPTMMLSDPGANAQYKPNGRPEECLRVRLLSGGGVGEREGDRVGLYVPGGAVLTVGDGDLSFSLSLARGILLGKKGSLVATTHLTRAELDAAYGAAKMRETVRELKRHGASVYHGVDAMSLASSLDQKGFPARQKFGRVVWNFPCIEGKGGSGKDAQLEEIEDNKALMRAFFESVVEVAVPGGEVHVTHKTKPPFCHWEMDRLAASVKKLCYFGRVVFDHSLYPGYNCRKVSTGRGSFPTWDAVTHIWGVKGTLNEISACKDTICRDWGSEVLAKGTRQSELAQRLSRLASEKGGKKGKGHKGGGECLLESAAKPIEMGSGTEGDGWGKKTAGSGSKKLLVCRAIVQVDDRLLDQVCQLLLLR